MQAGDAIAHLVREEGTGVLATLIRVLGGAGNPALVDAIDGLTG